jgi:cell wall-associated NlpC family hydrolase
MHRHRLRRRVPLAVAAALFAAPGIETAHAKTDMVETRPSPPKSDRQAPATTAALTAARTRIGSAYAMGATGPGAFDCSGLTMWAFARAGVALPHSSFAQFGMGRPVDRAQIQAGDLVFFDTAGPGASHVGVATGKGTAVSATSSGVMEHAIGDAYWGAAYVGARRIAAN